MTINTGAEVKCEAVVSGDVNIEDDLEIITMDELVENLCSLEHFTGKTVKVSISSAATDRAFYLDCSKYQKPETERRAPYSQTRVIMRVEPPSTAKLQVVPKA
jgi:hypothetical protein